MKMTLEDDYDYYFNYYYYYCLPSDALSKIVGI